MTDPTARFALPSIDPGQAQKELTHNEALARIDAALQPAVKAVGVATAPATPAIGDQWIVGADPTGDWVGQAHALATWTAGGWRFVMPVEGMTAWSIADGVPARFAAGGWSVGDLAAARLMVGGVQVVGARHPAIAPPAGGAAIDGEARTAIGAIIAALTGHGLIADR